MHFHKCKHTHEHTTSEKICKNTLTYINKQTHKHSPVLLVFVLEFVMMRKTIVAAVVGVQLVLSARPTAQRRCCYFVVRHREPAIKRESKKV